MHLLYPRLTWKSAPVAALAAAAVFFSSDARATVDLVNLGAPSFTVDSGATSASYTQTSESLVFSNAYSLGDTLGGTFSGQNWSSYATFGVRMTVSGSNPNLPFSVQFYDGSFSVINTYQGTTDLSDGSSLATLSLSEAGTGVLTDVAGLQITWDGAGTINASFMELVGFTPPDAGDYTARAPGGVRFLTGTNNVSAPETSLASDATNWNPPTLATTLPAGSTSWAMLSDSNAKTDIAPVDHREVLRHVEELPVTSWQYKHDATRFHVGPMAQDFSKHFGLGEDDTRIATIDADGVALSALKGLIEQLQERKERSFAQSERIAQLERELLTLRDRIAAVVSADP